MNTEGKFIHVRTFAAEIEDTNLRVRDTAIEARFGVWLWKASGQ